MLEIQFIKEQIFPAASIDIVEISGKIILSRVATELFNIISLV